MRRIDWLAGIPLCAALGAWRRTWRRLGLGRPEPGAARRIVAFKLLGAGSLLLAAPALRALKDQGRGRSARLVLVTFREQAQAARLIGVADEILLIDRTGPGRFLLDTLRVIVRLRRFRPDLAVDLEFFAKYSVLLAALSGAPRVAGYDLRLEPWRQGLLDVRGYYNHYRHVREIFLSLAYLARTGDAAYAGFDAFCRRYPPLALRVLAGARAAARAAVRAAGAPPGAPVFVVHAHASADTSPQLKRWPPDRMAALAAALARSRAGSVVALTGTAGERELNDAIIARLAAPLRRRVLNLAGRTDLPTLAALCAGARAVVSVDSGPLHLAAAAGARVVGLFLAETPVLYAPLGRRALAVAPDRYALPLFTVYTGKVPVAAGGGLANAVSVREVLAAVAAVMRK